MLRKTYKDLLVNEISKQLIKEGLLPSQDEINRRLKLITQGKDLSKPLTTLDSFVGERERGSASKYNKFIDNLRRDTTALYANALEQQRTAMDSASRKTFQLEVLERRLLSLREELQTILLAKKGTLGYFNYIFEGFNSLDNTLLGEDNTDLLVDIKNAHLRLKKDASSPIILENRNIEVRALTTKDNIELARNNVDGNTSPSSGSMISYTMSKTSASPGDVEVIIRISDTQVEVNRIEFVPKNRGVCTAFYSLDGVGYKIVPSIQPSIDISASGQAVFSFTPVQAKYIKLYLYNPFYKTVNKKYEFSFSIESLNISRTTYRKEGTYYSKILFTQDQEDNGQEYDQLALSACEVLPNNETSITYEVRPITQTLFQTIDISPFSQGAENTAIRDLFPTENGKPIYGITPLEREGKGKKVMSVGSTFRDPFTNFNMINVDSSKITFSPADDLSNLGEGSLIRDKFRREFYLTNIENTGKTASYTIVDGQSLDGFNLPQVGPALLISRVLLSNPTAFNATPIRSTAFRDGDRIDTLILDYRFPSTVIPQDTRLWRNLGNNTQKRALDIGPVLVDDTETGWKNLEGVYETWVYVDNADGIEIDFGTLNVIVDGKSYSKIVLTKGIHSIRVSKSDWTPIKVESTWTTTNPGSLLSENYKTNPKYLIEGIVKPDSASAILYGRRFHINYVDPDRVFNGVKFYAASYSEIVSRFNLLTRTSLPYSKHAVIQDTSPQDRILIKYNSGYESQHLSNERFIVDRKEQITESAIGAAVKITMTSDSSSNFSPIVENYKLKLSR